MAVLFNDRCTISNLDLFLLCLLYLSLICCLFITKPEARVTDLILSYLGLEMRTRCLIMMQMFYPCAQNLSPKITRIYHPPIIIFETLYFLAPCKPSKS